MQRSITPDSTLLSDIGLNSCQDKNENWTELREPFLHQNRFSNTLLFHHQPHPDFKKTRRKRKLFAKNPGIYPH